MNLDGGQSLELSGNCRPSILYAKENNISTKYVAEIGIGYGVNAAYILNNLNPEKLFLVDPLEYGEDCTEFESSIPWDIPVSKIKDTFKEEIDSGKVIFYNRPSVEGADLVDIPLDFVYIDGSHSYKNVLKDIKAWYPKIREGGIIAGHDLGNEVTQAVEEVFGKNYMFKEGYIDWWVIKQKEKV